MFRFWREIWLSNTFSMLTWIARLEKRNPFMVLLTMVYHSNGTVATGDGRGFNDLLSARLTNRHHIRFYSWPVSQQGALFVMASHSRFDPWPSLLGRLPRELIAAAAFCVGKQKIRSLTLYNSQAFWQNLLGWGWRPAATWGTGSQQATSQIKYQQFFTKCELYEARARRSSSYLTADQKKLQENDEKA